MNGNRELRNRRHALDARGIIMDPNSIYCGDCLEVMKDFPDESIDLIYLDPPFFSNKHYEVIWGDGSEIRSFEDRWKGGKENYLNWMKIRIQECHRLLKQTGSLYLHCDWHASHHLKIEMDAIFGTKNFRNDIVWHYYNKLQGNIKNFPRNHDNILYYTKSDIFTFNDILEKRDKPVKMSKRIWIKDKEKIKGGYLGTDRDDDGKPLYIMREDRRIDNVWRISMIIPSSKERMGWPTQKPEALLERIIKASSNEGELVLDPFCGCGTTISVAEKLNRKWIGIDVSPVGCTTMKKRFSNSNLRKPPHIYNLPKDEEQLRKLQPHEFQNWICNKLGGRVNRKMSGDMGIDGWDKDNNPIQVKQSDRVSRNIIDNFETAIRRAKNNKGTVVAFSFSKSAYEEIARAKNHDDIDIQLITVSEILRRRKS